MREAMSALPPKADIDWPRAELCPLSANSGHKPAISRSYVYNHGNAGSTLDKCPRISPP